MYFNNWIEYLSHYTGKAPQDILLEDLPMDEIIGDIQNQYKKEVEELAYDTISIEEDTHEDGQIYTNIDVDNFLEALFEEYRLEKK